VTDSEHVGDPTQYGVISGSVEAHLTLPDSTLPLDLGGTWGCVIESTANASWSPCDRDCTAGAKSEFDSAYWSA